MKPALDAPIHATASVIDHILATGYPALVVFETPDCGPCQSLRPVLDELAREFEGRLVVVRVTDASEGWLAARYHLSFVPTLLLWRDEVEYARIKGNPGRAALRAHLECLISRRRPPPHPMGGPRHTLEARFGARAENAAWHPRALLLAGSGFR
jgi:thioredoxin 1